MEQDQKDRSRVSKVLEALATGIVEGKYSAGLPRQDELSTEFGVSHTVMREALSVLRARNMLDVRRQAGTHVLPAHDWRMIDEDVVGWRLRARPDPTFLRDIIELRLLIEPRAAALAAARGDPADVAAIGEAFDVFRATRPGEPSYQAAGELLRMRIVTASGNQFFQQMAIIIGGTPSTLNLVANSREGAWGDAVRAYGRVVEAIERADQNEAEVASFALFDHWGGESMPSQPDLFIRGPAPSECSLTDALVTKEAT
ncbi:FCD domain-containing protein [Paraburkholderia sediminicola]|uniref:FadR/GntR family transcriptional regulator n=1 Tax=Paraburkholderia sediminicola TaxID=458836 RepID=UPI0038B7DE8D